MGDDSSFLDLMSSHEQQMQVRREELQQAIDSEYKQLRDELNLFKESQLKEMNMEEDEVERQLVIFDTYKNTSTELLHEGSEFDICRSARHEQTVLSQ